MNKYTEELRKVLKQSEIEAIENKDSLVGTEHILLSLFKITTSLTTTLKKVSLDYKKIKELIPNGTSNKEFVFYKNELLKIIENIIISKQDIEEEITLPSFITKILEDTKTNMYKILKRLDINVQKLKEELKTKEVENASLLIKELAINLNEEAKNGTLDRVIGRDLEIERLIEVLARKNKNNPLLVGEAGVGKTAIVEELARRITEGNVPEFLLNKEILNLNIANVIAGTKYRGEFEEKLSKIIKELENVDNLILFIDEVHTLVGAGGAEGAIDASNILKPALARGKIKCIGATTSIEYKNTIEKDKALERRFQKIYVNAPSFEETKHILNKIKKDYEKYHNVIVPEEILNLTITLSNKYIKDRNEPDKSIDILDEICAMTSIKENNTNYNTIKNKIERLCKEKNDYLLKNDITNAKKIKKQIDNLKTKLEKTDKIKTKNIVDINALKKVLETKTSSRIFELEDKSYLTELHTHLKTYMINKDEAINKLINITNTHFNKNNSLPTSILLTGKTGTGKSYLLDEYIKFLKLNLIKLNMNDYKDEISINKIIGSPAGYIGYDDKNTVFEKIKTFPLSVILIENYEQAHNKIINLLYSILETGKLKLATNETLDFSNSLFIFTETTKDSISPVGFIINNNLSTSNKFKHTITLNELTRDNIIDIIKLKNNKLSLENIDTILIKANYQKEGAKLVNDLLDEITVNL